MANERTDRALAARPMAVILGIVAAVLPERRAAKLKPVDALTDE